jgi:hypothetical protein
VNAASLLIDPLHFYPEPGQHAGATFTSQQNHSDANEELEFDRAVERYREEFTRLKGARAAVPRDDARVSQFKEEPAATFLVRRSQNCRHRLSQDTAILFYDYDEDGHLRAWLIDKRGVKGFSQSNVGLEQIRSTVAG